MKCLRHENCINHRKMWLKMHWGKVLQGHFNYQVLQFWNKYIDTSNLNHYLSSQKLPSKQNELQLQKSHKQHRVIYHFYLRLEKFICKIIIVKNVIYRLKADQNELVF